MADMGLAWPCGLPVCARTKTPITTLRHRCSFASCLRQAPSCILVGHSLWPASLQNSHHLTSLILKPRPHPPGPHTDLTVPFCLSALRDEPVSGLAITATAPQPSCMRRPRRPHQPSDIDEQYQSKKGFAGDRNLAGGILFTPQDAPETIACRSNTNTLGHIHSRPEAARRRLPAILPGCADIMGERGILHMLARPQRHSRPMSRSSGVSIQ